MEITVISRETIKPSSPTPPHLKHWKLSLIDQSMKAVSHGRILFFYSAQGDPNRFQNTNMSDRLKISLSEALTEFYPVAGRLVNDQFIDCNDDGLEYIEARVKGPLTLDQLVTSPKVEKLDQLLPYDASTYGAGFKGQWAFQVTVFDACGSMAIGVSFLHMVADLASAIMFINAWAANARGGVTRMPGKTGLFNYAALLPTRDIPLQITDLPSTWAAAATKLVSKRFVFPQLKINTLKGQFEYPSRLTRVEVVSALIFKCLINGSTSSSSKPAALCISIDISHRMSPPLHRPYLGNMVLVLMKQISPEMSLTDLAVQIREQVKEIDDNYVKKLQADKALLLQERLAQQVKVFTNTDARALLLTSWCRFPFHEVDVGWGAPTWVTPVIPNGKDFIFILDAKNGDGIEAWLTLDEGDMAQFESEFLHFTGSIPKIGKL